MGSFNTTCIASGQTIAPGDRCYLLPIRHSHDYNPVEMTVNGKIHKRYGITSFNGAPHAFWHPVGDFIEARYDDCFMFEPLATPANANRLLQLLCEFARNTAVSAPGENACHDIAVGIAAFVSAELPLLQRRLDSEKPSAIQYSAEEMEALVNELHQGFDYVLEAACEHRLFIMERNEPFPVEFAVLHAAAYDRLIALTESCKGWNGESLDRRSHFDRAIEKANAGMDAEDLAELQKATDVGDEDEVRMLNRIHHMNRESAFRDEFQRIGRFEGLRYVGEFPGLMYRIRQYLDEKLSIEDFYQAVLPMLETRYVVHGLYLINQKLRPMSYCSQDYQNEIGGRFADFVQRTSTVVTKARKEYHGDYDDE